MKLDKAQVNFTTFRATLATLGLATLAGCAAQSYSAQTAASQALLQAAEAARAAQLAEAQAVGFQTTVFMAVSDADRETAPSLMVMADLVSAPTDPSKESSEARAQRVFGNAATISLATEMAELFRERGLHSTVGIASTDLELRGESLAADQRVHVRVDLGYESRYLNVSYQCYAAWLGGPPGLPELDGTVRLEWSDAYEMEQGQAGAELGIRSSTVAYMVDEVSKAMSSLPNSRKALAAFKALAYGVDPVPGEILPRVGERTLKTLEQLEAKEDQYFFRPLALQYKGVQERVEPAVAQYAASMHQVVEERARIARQEAAAREQASDRRNAAMLGGFISALGSAANNYGNPYAFQAESAMIQMRVQADIATVNENLERIVESNEATLRAADNAAGELSAGVAEAVDGVLIEFEGEQVELKGGTVAERLKAFREFAKKKLEQAIKEDGLAKS